MYKTYNYYIYVLLYNTSTIYIPRLIHKKIINSFPRKCIYQTFMSKANNE